MEQLPGDAVDVFGYPPSGPLTAPASSHNKLFWDLDSSIDTIDLGSFEGNPMGFENPRSAGAYDWPHDHEQIFSEPINAGSTAAPHYGHYTQGLAFDDETAGLGGSGSTPTTGPSRLSFEGRPAPPPRLNTGKTDRSVDPTLLFSFSSPTRPVSDNAEPKRSASFRAEKSRQPYQHQLEEMKRERGSELARKGARTHKAGSNSENIAPRGQADRPGLKRRVTDGSLKPRFSDSDGQAQLSFGKPHTSVSVRRNPSVRRTSPSRRADRLNAIQESSGVPKRAAVTFSIDPSGRAMTETRILETEGQERVESRSRRDESDDSESDSSGRSDLDISTSFTSSFTFPDSGTRRPKVARFSTDSLVQRRLSQTSAGGHTNAGRNHRASGSWDTPPKSVGFGQPESEAETVIDGGTPGDAQSALREVLEKRSRSRGGTTQLSQVSYQPAFDSYGPQGYFGQPSMQNVSPTTITDPDIATPSTDRSIQACGSTRCVCSVTDSGGHLMIQCDSCSKWLHVRCVGLNTKALPPVYVCVHCTGLTPTVRGGRVREPHHAAYALGSSPLARKAQKTRHP
ncbi:MAG: hypothetical protein M1832_000715 [Thelocarpon impressellum]|nr:MAG: hypothetical protein M1832_000715 [Thelocarpon impressellum]